MRGEVTATSRVLSSSHFFQGAIECSGVANPAAAAVIIFIFIIIIIIIIVVVVIVIVICFGQTSFDAVTSFSRCCFCEFHGKFQGNGKSIDFIGRANPSSAEVWKLPSQCVVVLYPFRFSLLFMALGWPDGVLALVAKFALDLLAQLLIFIFIYIANETKSKK
jgi:hypothetical protein